MRTLLSATSVDAVPAISKCDADGVPSDEELQEAVKMLRRITEATVRLPEDSLVDAQLRQQLDLAATVFDAVVRSTDQPHGGGLSQDRP